MLKNIVIALAAIVMLAGCGIKPNSVSPPKEAEKDGFPHTYPNPANEPQPVGK